ncbi:MAG: DUF933 domain-containing protein, partial [bacterium]|nr:DUF933 domain-containing protein [bacterium]
AGLVKGASEGQGLGNKFLTHIREVDAIAEVVRAFEDKDIIHVSGKVNPLDDISVINLELVLADLETVTKRLASVEKDVKSQVKEAVAEKAVLEKIKPILEEGRIATEADLSKEDKLLVKQLNLLTLKPILYVLNFSEAGENEEEIVSKIPGPYVKIDPVFEKGLDDLIKEGYKMLNLITYFTTGEDETRAWTIPNGWTAPLAGTAIHTDFKDKFVRAEVIECEKLLEAGSYASARENGWVRTEGKEYVVKDGDVIEFKI